MPFETHFKVCCMFEYVSQLKRRIIISTGETDKIGKIEETGKAGEISQKNNTVVRKNVHNIFDKTFKRLMRLSSKAVVNLINGLYGTEYDVNSKVTYLSTESVDDKYNEIRADEIIKIEGGVYHLEAQMYQDDNIVFRVFGYGYMNASADITNNVLNFPEPKIIYLCSDKRAVPEKMTLTLNFGNQGIFKYEVGTFDYIRTSVDELNRRKMILFIPFQLLKLREKMKKSRDADTIEELKNILINDILKSIESNLKCGNINEADACMLKESTLVLYKYLYSDYDEMKDGGINSMVDGILELEVDKVIAEVTNKVTNEVTNKVRNEDVIKTVLLLQEAGIDNGQIREKILANFDITEEEMDKILKQ